MRKVEMIYELETQLDLCNIKYEHAYGDPRGGAEQLKRVLQQLLELP